jgi:hypothetical protein
VVVGRSPIGDPGGQFVDHRLGTTDAFVEPQRPIELAFVLDGKSASISSSDQRAQEWRQVDGTGAELTEPPVIEAFEMHVRDERLQLLKGGQAVDAGVLEVDRIEIQARVRTLDALENLAAILGRDEAPSWFSNTNDMSEYRSASCWMLVTIAVSALADQASRASRPKGSRIRRSGSLLWDVVDGSQKMTYLLTE